jgi:hypothetical protein
MEWIHFPLGYIVSELALLIPNEQLFTYSMAL